MPVRPAWRLALVFPVFQSLLTLLLFGGMLLDNSWFFLNSIYSLANVTIVVLGMFVILGLALWDRVTTHDRRDWLHWLGVAAMLIWNLPTLILRLFDWLGVSTFPE